MSLKDLNEACQGLLDSCCFANGSIHVRASGAVAGPATPSYLCTTLLATDGAQGNTPVDDVCNATTTATTSPPPQPPCHAAGPSSRVIAPDMMAASSPRPDRIVVVITDWNGAAWAATASLQDIVSANDNNNDEVSGGDNTNSISSNKNGNCPVLHISQTVTNWRRFFSSLCTQVTRPSSSSEVYVELVKDGATLHFRELHCTIRCRAIANPLAARDVSLWTASQLSRAFYRTSCVNDELQKKCKALQDDMQSMRSQAGASLGQAAKGSEERTDSARAISPSGGGGGRSRPANLVNPQARVGTKRPRGMRIQEP